MHFHTKQPRKPALISARFVFPCAALLAAFILLAISHSANAQSDNSYGKQLDSKFANNTSKPDENSLTPEQIKNLDIQRAVRAEAKRMAQPLPPPPPPPSMSVDSGLFMALVAILGVGLCLGLAIHLLKRKLDTLMDTAELARNRLNLVENDPSLEGFFIQLRDGLDADYAANGSLNDAKPGREPLSLDAFLASVPPRFADIRTTLSELARVSEPTIRKRSLSSLYDQVISLKDDSHIPALQPAWLMACALDGLLKQLRNETSEFNPSIHRSIAAAVDTLQMLCAEGVNPNLAAEPPIQILAVDDDPISRCAISFSLKKAFHTPRLAVNGEQALSWAARHAYDIIFLDVEMPGMDGFELCTKIHQIPCNQSTPIVFVTRHSDFDSRAKSDFCGAQDLIGKPYMASEITIKALTLVLRNRLQNGVSAPRVVDTAFENTTLLLKKDLPNSAASGREPRRHTYNRAEANTHSATAGHSEDANGLPASAESYGRLSDRPDEFSLWAPAYLENLLNQLRAASCCSEPAALQELLAGVYAGVRSFSKDSESVGSSTVHKLSAVLEVMVKKLLANPNLFTPSILNAAIAALDLMADLSSATKTNSPDFANPPARILVVDDDPVARRAVSGSIQLVFGKPDNAENGEAALALADQTPFDLVFLDVLMPGVDGFATCEKIHQTVANRETPVLFITNHDNGEYRTQAAMAGGCGFVPKPVLSSQIILMALTFILRARLDKIQSAPGEASAVSETTFVSAA